VSEPPPTGPRHESGAALAERLLATRRLISSLNVDADARMRFHLRLAAICTALKAPGASQARVARRLDRLVADATRTEREYTSRLG
jgi:hypothetical protein